VTKRNPTAAAIPDVEKRFLWYSQSSAHATEVGEWDLKSQQLVDAILALLSAGCGVMFGRTRDGGAIAITIFDGDDRARTYADDSIALDDWANGVIAGARQAGIGRFGRKTAPSVELPAD
jgi:hypothetical protein